MTNENTNLRLVEGFRWTCCESEVVFWYNEGQQNVVAFGGLGNEMADSDTVEATCRLTGETVLVNAMGGFHGAFCMTEEADREFQNTRTR